MKKKKVGLITFALLLITFGVIMLLHSFWDFNIIAVMRIIVPSSLIILGIEYFILSLYYKRKNITIALTFSKFLIVVLIVLTVVFSTSPSSLNLVTFSINGFNFNESTVIHHETKTFNAEDINQLKLESTHSQIDVVGYEGDEIVVDYILRTYGSEDALEELDTDHIVEFSHENGIFKIMKSNLETPIISGPFFSTWVTAEYTIKVPTKISMDFDTTHGYITVSETEGGITIDSPHTTINLDHIIGNLAITNTHDDINLREIQGDINITTSHNNVDMNGIYGNVTIKGAHSDIEIVKSLKDITIENRHGDISIENPKPLTNVKYTISNTHNDVWLGLAENQEGQFDLKTSHGSIRGLDHISRNESNNKESLNTQIGSSNNMFKIETTHGNITLK